MSIWEATLLGILEGFTEFLPISSTGHLTIAEKLLGYSINHPDITAFTAIIQVGAVLATVIFFRGDLQRLFAGWLRGVLRPEYRRNTDFRFAWAVILGSIPIGIAGLLFKEQIETTLRSLWFVSFALIIWSGAMWVADRKALQSRHEADTTWKDTLIIGLTQCLALIPGISRSGATMTAGLLRGLDRIAVTRLSFFLSIPALLAAGTFQIATNFDAIGNGVGWAATVTATVASFIVAYLTVSWLLRFVSRHSYLPFIVYRLILGTFILSLLFTGTISAT